MKVKNHPSFPKEKEGHWSGGIYYDDYSEYNQALTEVGELETCLNMKKISKMLSEVKLVTYSIEEDTESNIKHIKGSMCNILAQAIIEAFDKGELCSG